VPAPARIEDVPAEMKDCCISVRPRPCPWDAGAQQDIMKPRARP
jgi:hypothetical protein